MSNYIVTVAWLRLRAGPGTNHKTLGYLARNSIVQSDQQKDGWLHVLDSAGKSGWSSAKHLKKLDALDAQPTSTTGLGNYTVNSAALHMRQGPGKGYTVLGSLSQGELVEGLAQSLDGQWTQIKKANGPLGWSATKYLSKVIVSAPLPETEMIVTANMLNIRSSAGSNYSILGAVHKGQVVKVVNVTPDWAWMQIGGLGGGWCSSKYLLEREMLSLTPEDLSALGNQRVATYVLSMRAKPGPNQAVIGALNFNQVVQVDEISEDKLWKHCITAQGNAGWCSFEFLAAVRDVGAPKEHEEFPWLPIAFSELGTCEIPGGQSNPKILGYLASTDLFKYPYLPDETDWCAAFVNWCVEKAGIQSANSALAFPWSRWGRELQTPRRGCVVAFQWDNGRQHVSFYLGEISNYVLALGGNQSDAVWISIYHKRHVLGYRVPENWPENPSMA